MGAAVLEGLVDDPEEARRALRGRAARAASSRATTGGAVGPMAGVVTPSMWMFVLEDPATGARTHCTLNEGLGKVLRYGAYSPEVLDPAALDGRRARARCCSGPSGRATPVDVTAILGQMLQMGDEAHNRNRAGTLMLLRDLGPALVASGADAADVAEVLRFVGGNDHFFLNLAMPACKLALDAARDDPGLDDGRGDVAQRHRLRDPGLGHRRRVVHRPRPGRRRPLPRRLRARRRQPRHRRLRDHRDGRARRLRDGDGAGHRALRRRLGARRPGHHPPDAARSRSARTRAGASRCWSSPACPTGIDVSRVCRTGILPQINTGMAGRGAGVGQVGAGLVTPPEEIFPKALTRLAELTRERAAARTPA